jgi:SAM-dependent methyltransferase
VRASASCLPFRDGAFDAALAVLTIHLWPDLGRGLAELRRTARHRVVILTHDTTLPMFWLADYFPEIAERVRQSVPSLDEVRRHLGALTIVDVPVPDDCRDGFLGAYWRRPHHYLDAEVRSGISLFAKLPRVELGLAALRDDLVSGEWRARGRENRRRRAARRALRHSLRDLRRWGHPGSDFVHMLQLLEAHRLRSRGEAHAALALYAKAADAALVHKHRHNAALAHEARAELLEELGRSVRALAARLAVSGS